MYVTAEGGARNLAGQQKIMEGKMKAVFINAEDQKVEAVEVGTSLKALYRQLKCETIELVRLGGNYLLIVDEEGRLRNWKVGFRLADGEKIAGNGLIVRADGNGDFTDCPLPAGLVAEMTVFLDLEKNPLPPPKFEFVAISEFTPEGRAEARKDEVKE